LQKAIVVARAGWACWDWGYDITATDQAWRYWPLPGYQHTMRVLLWLDVLELILGSGISLPLSAPGRASSSASQLLRAFCRRVPILHHTRSRLPVGLHVSLDNLILTSASSASSFSSSSSSKVSCFVSLLLRFSSVGSLKSSLSSSPTLYRPRLLGVVVELASTL